MYNTGNGRVITFILNGSTAYHTSSFHNQGALQIHPSQKVISQ